MRVFREIFIQTFRTLWAHKMRSFLTMFGIAWGVGSLLLLVGVGEGFRTGNRKQLATFGQDIMFLFPGRVPAIEGQAQFLAAGGQQLRYIRCLNDSSGFIRALADLVERNVQGWPVDPGQLEALSREARRSAELAMALGARQ